MFQRSNKFRLRSTHLTTFLIRECYNPKNLEKIINLLYSLLTQSLHLLLSVFFTRFALDGEASTLKVRIKK